METPTEYSLRIEDYISFVHRVPNDVPFTVIHMLHSRNVAVDAPSFCFLPRCFLEEPSPAGVAAIREAGIAPAETRFFSASSTNLPLHKFALCDVVTARRYENLASYAKNEAMKAYACIDDAAMPEGGSEKKLTFCRH